jgi:hypothetical protein
MVLAGEVTAAYLNCGLWRLIKKNKPQNLKYWRVAPPLHKHCLCFSG